MLALLVLLAIWVVFGPAILIGMQSANRRAEIGVLRERVEVLEALTRPEPVAAQAPAAFVRGDPVTAAPVPEVDLPERVAVAEPVAPAWAYVPRARKPRVRHERGPSRLSAFLAGRSMEDVIGENLLAIVGGVFVVIGAVFFLALAIHHGWIGPAGRVILALLGGAALTGLGLHLAARRSAGPVVSSGGAHAIGSLHGVVTGTGIAVLFLGDIVATRVYGVLPASAGLVAALLIGACAAAIAIRWRSQDLAGFGILGALAAPILVGAPASFTTLAFMGIALIAAVAVVVAERWPWLLTVTVLVTAPQLAVGPRPDADR